MNNRLKSLRLAANLTQSELGQKLTQNGYQKQFVSDVENGRYKPGLDVIRNWANACGFDVVISFRKKK